jgi:putative phosphoserine phosphatase/1-acylglycerol-3-phosphate O-acyltransferase
VSARPRIGAFFDFDGTLLYGYSVTAFLADRVRRRAVGAAEVGRLARGVLDVLSGDADNRALLERGIAEWGGRPLQEMRELGERIFETALEPRLFPEMRDLIAWHRRAGHRLVIASSATPFQVEPAARCLGIDTILCTRLEAQDGHLTGRLDGPLLWGEQKALAVQRFATQQGIDLGQSFFYADGDEDEALMHLVGNPRPTNPQRRLARVAARRGWPVQHFSSRGPARADTLLRYAATTVGLVPTFAGALAVRTLTGSRRAAANIVTSVLPDLALALGKVELNVVGEEHLWSHRPAVFVFNHRNIFDVEIAAKLVRRDFAGVAKKELEHDPLFALASRFIDIAFVDRRDHKQALEALQPVTRMIADGVSLLIAPEGTRVSGGGMGPFKKGAFRIAMAARVPIVPIVIRNAEILGARDALVLRPGRVDVAVLPPIDVSGWTHSNLVARIEGVRRLFVQTLEQWPQRQRPLRARPRPAARRR